MTVVGPSAQAQEVVTHQCIGIPTDFRTTSGSTTTGVSGWSYSQNPPAWTRDTTGLLINSQGALIGGPFSLGSNIVSLTIVATFTGNVSNQYFLTGYGGNDNESNYFTQEMQGNNTAVTWEPTGPQKAIISNPLYGFYIRLQTNEEPNGRLISINFIGQCLGEDPNSTSSSSSTTTTTSTSIPTSTSTTSTTTTTPPPVVTTTTTSRRPPLQHRSWCSLPFRQQHR